MMLHLLKQRKNDDDHYDDYAIDETYRYTVDEHKWTANELIL